MIDWHSHILPGVDDGSRDVRESVGMLRMLADQGVSAVAATPHFLADRESPDQFLARRDRALARLKQEYPAGLPEIRCGAEAAYYPGIGRLDGLERLCIQGTDLLLLEMPMSKWTDFTVRELAGISGQKGVTLILAHIERYWSMQSVEVWNRLLEQGILMQCNAGFFLGFGTKRRALAMLGEGRIHLIGSDCHNLTSRPPKIGQAGAVIEKKFGRDFLDGMNQFGKALLEK